MRGFTEWLFCVLEAGQHSLDELAYRRRGLLIALGVILTALVAMALKIRQL